MKQKGFTLIELLIVMACFLVINLIIIHLFDFSLDSSQVRAPSFGKIGWQRTVLNQMAKDIRQADSVGKKYHAIKSSPETLILKLSDGNWVVYAKDTIHTDTLLRTRYDSKGQGMTMTVLRDLQKVRFGVEKNLVSVELISLDKNSPSNHLYQDQLTVKMRKEI